MPIHIFSNDDDFESFFKSHSPKVKNFARKYINDAAIVDDIVMDVFAQVWLKRDQFPNLLATRQFLFNCTRNACLNHIKRVLMRSRKKKDVLMYLLEWAGNEMEDLRKQKLTWRLYAAIDELDDKYRVIIVMYYFMKMTCVKIGFVLNVPSKTIRNRKTKAENLLKDKLNLPGTEDEWLL